MDSPDLKEGDKEQSVLHKLWYQVWMSRKNTGTRPPNQFTLSLGSAPDQPRPQSMSKCFDLVEPDPIFFWDIQDFKSSMLLNDRSTSVTSPRYKCLIFISWLDRRSSLRKMRRSDVGKWDGQCLQSLPQCYVIFYTKSGPILITFLMYTYFSCWKLQICLGGKLGNQHQCGFVDCACHPLIHNDNI